VLGIEIVAFGLLLGFHWYFSILAQRKLLQSAMSQVQETISQLDLSLGEAIEMVTSNASQGQNPLVGVLSQVLMQNLDPKKAEPKIIQGSDGKFLKNE
jgi:hypothetical protein